MRSTPTRIGAAEAQNFLEDLRYFKYRAILDAPDTRAIILELRGQPHDGAANALERVEHHPGVVLQHPLGVIALLRHGPGIAHHDHGQPLLNRFADAAGTRLADEEIGELHEVADMR